MKEAYVVNNDQTKNPGEHHEVHTRVHAKKLGINDYQNLGLFNNCKEALKKAKLIYADADGCKICCSECHTG